MRELVIKVVGRDGKILHESGTKDSVIEAGARATQMVWRSEGACGYELWDGNRAVVSHYIPTLALMPDPLRIVHGE